MDLIVFRLFILTAIIIPLFQGLKAQETIHFGTFIIPQFVQNSDQGEFVKLARHISSRIGLDAQIEIYPPKRLIKYFAQEKFDVIFPGVDIRIGPKHIEMIKTRPYYIKRDHLFSLKTTGTNIRGKTLCLTTGYPYDEKFIEKNDLKIVYTKSDEKCLRMLTLKRADYFLCELASGVSAIRNVLSTDTNPYRVNPRPVSELPVYFAFKKSNAELAKKFDHELDILKSSGYFDDLYKGTKELVRTYFDLEFNPL